MQDLIKNVLENFLWASFVGIVLSCICVLAYAMFVEVTGKEDDRKKEEK
jgi:hypothetical protein